MIWGSSGYYTTAQTCIANWKPYPTFSTQSRLELIYYAFEVTHYAFEQCPYYAPIMLYFHLTTAIWIHFKVAKSTKPYSKCLN